MRDPATAVDALLGAAGIRVREEERERLVQLYSKVRSIADSVAAAADQRLLGEPPKDPA